MNLVILIEVTCYQESDNSSLLNKDELVLESLRKNEYELLGIKLSIWDLVMWCNLRIKDIILIVRKMQKRIESIFLEKLESIELIDMLS